MGSSQNKKILIIVHQEHSTPGRIGMMLKAMGFALDIEGHLLEMLCLRQWMSMRGPSFLAGR